MGTDIDHSAGEALVIHSGHCEQELPVQETLLLVWLPENGHVYEGSKTAANDNEIRAIFL